MWFILLGIISATTMLNFNSIIHLKGLPLIEANGKEGLLAFEFIILFHSVSHTWLTCGFTSKKLNYRTNLVWSIVRARGIWFISYRPLIVLQEIFLKSCKTHHRILERELVKKNINFETLSLTNFISRVKIFQIRK